MNKKLNIEYSKMTEPILNTMYIPAPKGEKYLPFQEAGIEILARRYIAGRKHQMLGDEPGLGKTIQAIGIANALKFRKLLIICPASLRFNWQSEINKWHRCNPGVNVIEKGQDKLNPETTNIISFDLLKKIGPEIKPDFICIDEAHKIKNPEAKRTQYVIGNKKENIPGLISRARSLLMTGSPLPNGRPNEIWHILKKCAPSSIDGMKYLDFVDRYCIVQYDDRGDFRVIGSKREKELYEKLRGSGYMVRRLKKEVLKDLPPKIYKMIVFPMTGSTAKVIKKESKFDQEEIVKYGRPISGGTPEIRKEMGVAKIPLAVKFIKDLLADGVQKVGVTTHHRDVSFGIHEALEEFNPVLYIGGMSDNNKDKAEKQFQNDPNTRVFIGSEAAGEGLTLTAAHHVVDVEPEWVPEANNQKHDRYHRISQTRGVIIYLLVVEQSLDARVLSSAAYKAQSTALILDNKGDKRF